MAPNRGSGLLEWTRVGYTDNVTSLYVSDDEYSGSIDELETDILLARQLATVHRVTADRMLMRVQRLDNDRNMRRIDEKFKLHHERLNEQLKAINKLKGTKRKDIGESEPDDPMQPVQVKREQIEEDEPAVRDIRERHRYMDSDEFDRAAGKADKGERLEERDLVFLLPPDRVLHRDVKGNTTAFIKGLPSDAGERIMLDVLTSFDGKLHSRRHFGLTALRFGY